jgi:two-component system, LytTR family, sensor kinase
MKINKGETSEFIKKNGEVIIHIVVWLLYIVLITTGLGEFWEKIDKINRIMIFLSFPIIFNLNLLYFIPRFLKKRKWLLHGLLIFLSSLLLELVLLLLTMFYEPMQNSDLHIVQILKSVFLIEGVLSLPIFLGLLLSYAYRFSRDWLINLTLIEKLKAEKLEMELAYLKSQIDPHFLFNTLNSLYGLALEEKGFNTAESIAKLGTLMRYNLHDSNQDNIELSKELDYIFKYIDLQKLRLSVRNKVEFINNINEQELIQRKITPMLLISFIENAFKYGVSPTEDTLIRITFSLLNDRFIIDIENTIIANFAVKEKSGIGLKNVKDRLNLMYANKHKLEIESKDSLYHVHLELII